jgi:hypothetical protein
MAYTLFISESRLKRLTAVHENLEPDELTPFVLQAQDVYVQELLGTKFYNNLKGRVISATTTSYETQLLNDYIAPMLANYAVYLALPSFNYKMKNKSVLNPSAEEAVNTGLSELKYLRGSVKDTSEFYRERAREFLMDNENEFPDYINYGVDGMSPNKRQAYHSNIVMPNQTTGCLPSDLNRKDPNAPYYE